MENCVPKKEDQRVRLTKTLLKEAFLQLLGEKPVQSVTVKQLCQQAGVNRGTFYLHYHDVYDLLEQLEAELLQDLDRLLAATPVIVPGESQEASGTFMKNLFSFFDKNWEMCAVLLGDNGDKRFVTAIVERAREKSVREYVQSYPSTSAKKAALFYYFIAWGFIGLIQQSLAAPEKIKPEDLVWAAERIVKEASRYFEENA